MILNNNRGVIMLKRFEVENFKGFKDNIVLDFSARDYAFNKPLVVNGIVNKAIVYGKNGIGNCAELSVAVEETYMHAEVGVLLNASVMTNRPVRFVKDI